VPGNLGVLDFSWPHPHIAAGGAHVPMHITPHGVNMHAKFARAESSRPDVATAKPFVLGAENLALITGEPGTTEISLYDENDRLLDAVDVAVTAAARIKYTGPYRATTAWYGPTLHVTATAYADDGLPLMGFWAIRAETSGAVELPAEEDDRMPDAEFVVQVLVAPATLHLVAHGASVSIPLAAPNPINAAW
jgi:hypothetical protein